jgi:hypothetical protein
LLSDEGIHDGQMGEMKGSLDGKVGDKKKWYKLSDCLFFLMPTVHGERTDDDGQRKRRREEEEDETKGSTYRGSYL